MIALLTDLGACLDSNDKLNDNVYIIQQKTFLKDDTHVENNLTTEEFYEIISKEGPGTTAAPSISDYINTFDQIEKSGFKKVVIAVMSEKISSTYSNAVIASNEYEGNLEFLIYKTNGVVSAEQAYFIDFINNDYKTLEEVKENFDKIHTKLIFTLDNINALKKGGRISPAQAIAASLLGIKPIIYLNDGKLELYDKVRSFTKAIDRMIDYVTTDVDQEKVFATAIISQGSDLQEKILENFSSKFTQISDIKIIEEIEPAVGNHTGSPLIGISVSWKD
jgi:DegV family protein with EDD domain